MSTPLLSVVIASHNPAAVLEHCLVALMAQATPDALEVIVADSSTDGTAEIVRKHFPEVRLLCFSEPLTIPYLRGAAIAAARGDLIAVLDPYSYVSSDWLTEVLRLHSQRLELVIGGSVELHEPDRAGLVTWATYFCEYGAFMLPLDAGPARELTGNNITYKREALAGISATGNGFWKSFVNRQLLSDGHSFRQEPSLVVNLHKPIPFAEFLRSRYHHGRCFGAMRGATSPSHIRLLRALSAPLIPVVSWWRRVRSVWPKRRNRRQFIRVLPLLFALDTYWAWGEMWGYLRGPHRSCGELWF